MGLNFCSSEEKLVALEELSDDMKMLRQRAPTEGDQTFLALKEGSERVQIRAHSLILQARCKKYSKVIRTADSRCYGDADVFNLFLDFVYTGKLDNSVVGQWLRLFLLQDLSINFGVPTLTSLCSQLLESASQTSSAGEQKSTGKEQEKSDGTDGSLRNGRLITKYDKEALLSIAEGMKKRHSPYRHIFDITVMAIQFPDPKLRGVIIELYKTDCLNGHMELTECIDDLLRSKDSNHTICVCNFIKVIGEDLVQILKAPLKKKFHHTTSLGSPQLDSTLTPGEIHWLDDGIKILEEKSKSAEHFVLKKTVLAALEVLREIKATQTKAGKVPEFAAHCSSSFFPVSEDRRSKLLNNLSKSNYYRL